MLPLGFGISLRPDFAPRKSNSQDLHCKRQIQVIISLLYCICTARRKEVNVEEIATNQSRDQIPASFGVGARKFTEIGLSSGVTLVSQGRLYWTLRELERYLLLNCYELQTSPSQCCPDSTTRSIAMLPRLLRCSTRPLRLFASPELHSYRTFSTSLWRREALTVEDDLASKLPNIDPSKLEITETITPKTVLPNEDLIFGRTFTGALHSGIMINTD